MADSKQLRLSGGASITPDGLLLTGYPSQAMVLGGQARSDCAIRMRATADGLRLGLRARLVEGGSHYNLDLPGKTTLRLQRWDNGARQSTVLREFPLPSGFDLSAEHEMELRLEGSTLTVSLDRQMLGTATDAVFKSGPFGVAVGGPIGKPVLIKSLEVLDLGAAAEPWQNLLADTSKLNFLKQVERTSEGLKLSENAAAYPAGHTGTQRDAAVRLRAIHGSLSAAIRARGSNGPCYQLYVSSDDYVTLLRNVEYGKTAPVANYHLKKPLQKGQEYELELRVVGQNLTSKLNGEALGTETDANLTQGNFGVAAAGSGASVLVKSFEFLDLDKPAAEPWQDVLRDPAKVILSNGAAATSDGIHMPPTSAVDLNQPGDLWRDAAVRMKTTFGGPRFQIRARGGNGSFYTLTASNEKTISLERFEKAAANGFKLQDFKPSKALQPGQDYELELRCVGSSLTASLDNEVLGIVTDDVLKQEIFSVVAWEKQAKSGTIKALKILRLDDLAAPVPTTSSAPNSPTFPPGQWVKLFTKAEDLPADLRKPDSGVKWEDGWIRGMKAGQVLPLPKTLAGNYAVRVRCVAAANDINGEGIVLRRQEPIDNTQRGHYQSKLSGDKLLLQQMVGGVYKTLQAISSPNIPTAQKEYMLEAGMVGKRLVSRLNSSFATTQIEDRFIRGNAFIAVLAPFRDIEVINLDGLPEAEALRLLGMDEKGNDLRGKGGAAK